MLSTDRGASSFCKNSSEQDYFQSKADPPHSFVALPSVYLAMRTLD